VWYLIINPGAAIVPSGHKVIFVYGSSKLSLIYYVEVFPYGFKNLVPLFNLQSGLSINTALYNVKNVLNTGKFAKLDFATILVGNNKQFTTASFIVVWFATTTFTFFISIFFGLIIITNPYNIQQATPKALKNIFTILHYLSVYRYGNFGKNNINILPIISKLIIIKINPIILYKIKIGETNISNA